jgi:NTE family protein
MSDVPNVAVACQGGGSHTAFTAGVLKRLLPALHCPASAGRDPEEPVGELVGMSGTSGGAISATAGWYGLLSPDSDPVDRLDATWADIAASSPTERLANDWFVWGVRASTGGLPTPEVSPYQLPATRWSQQQLRRTLERHVDFDRLPELVTAESPRLVVGTVNVNAGTFETFTDADITAEALLASAAVPDLFPAVEIHDHYHWDGLFSQNPPINDLMHVDAERKPDELWVVQINPQTRDDEPQSLREIADRRNELSGNISLNQELRFVETVNRWVEAGHLPEEYRRTEIRRIELGRSLGCPSKFDRSPELIEELIELGEQRAEEFLAG